MTDHIEWSPATTLPALYTPTEVAHLAQDPDEVAGQHGLRICPFSDGALVYGTPEELQAWLTAAIEELAEPLRKYRNAQIKAERKEAGEGKCPHSWMLVEDGYSRSWGTTIFDDGTIVAYSGGSGDYSEQGDGEYLICTNCDHVKPVPEGVEVDYR